MTVFWVGVAITVAAGVVFVVMGKLGLHRRDQVLTGTLAPQPATDVGRWDALRTPLLTIGGLAAATVALHFRDPHSQYSWGMCPSAALGLSCPGCGGLRAVNDLTNGDLAGAASSNLLLVVASRSSWSSSPCGRSTAGAARLQDPVAAAEAARPGAAGGGARLHGGTEPAAGAWLAP